MRLVTNDCWLKAGRSTISIAQKTSLSRLPQFVHVRAATQGQRNRLVTCEALNIIAAGFNGFSVVVIKACCSSCVVIGFCNISVIEVYDSDFAPTEVAKAEC